MLTEQQWLETKEKFLDGFVGGRKLLMEKLLDNTKRELFEASGPNVNSATGIASLPNVIIPMMRRVIPGTIATELVGVQPMNGPTGWACSLRYTYAETLNTGGVADITAGDEFLGNNAKTKRFYSGGGVGIDGIPGTADDVGTGRAAPLNDFESFGGRHLTLRMFRQTITAQTRRLQAKFTMEAMHDLSTQYGLDIESELTAGLSAAIVQEIDNEIITDLTALAGTTRAFDMQGGTFTGVPNYVGDRHAVLGVLMNEVAQEIARKTRIGAANWAVVSPAVAAALQSAAKSVFAPAVSGSFEGPNGTRLIGTLNGSIKIYSYLWHTTGTEPILMGYKGGNGEMQSGYFYCPYVPITSSGTFPAPNTYERQFSLSTRYGIGVFTDTNSSLGQSADYYGKINIITPITFF